MAGPIYREASRALDFNVAELRTSWIYIKRHLFRKRAHWPEAPPTRNIEIGGTGVLRSDSGSGVIFFANTGVEVPLFLQYQGMPLFRPDCG